MARLWSPRSARAVAVQPPTPVGLAELGYAHDAAGTGFWDDLTNEQTPELAWPNSVDVFDRMRRQDAQVSSVLRAVTSPIMRTPWSIDGRGCSDEVTEFVASNLGLPILGAESEGDNTAALRGRDRFSWSAHTRLALTMLPFGHSYFEQVYRYDNIGRARLRKLAFRPQRSISKVNVARDGGLISIEQHGLALAGASSTPIPVDRLVAYVLEREGGNWLGMSLLRAAYKNWLLKDRALRTWSTSVDRNGVGVPIYEAAPNEVDLTAGKKLATQIRGGSNAGGAIPNGAKLPIVGVDGMTVDIDKFVRYQDEQIARAVLAHFLNLGTQTGSWALGSTFADFFTLSLQAIAEDYRDVSTAHIVEDLVDINFGREVPAPRIHFDEIGSRGNGVNDEVAQLRKLAGLEDDEELARFIRENTTQGAAE
ncbi:MAG TPA: hypothetical protein VLI04_22220 [Nocardioidaceae bacterium]|nr:hypothetical protein [Nocardioidaceae bacterium]